MNRNGSRESGNFKEISREIRRYNYKGFNRETKGGSKVMKKFGIILEEQFGEEHSFYMLNCTRYVNGKKYHLLESEDYGEELQVIVDENMNYVKTASDGLDDLEYYFEED